MSNFEISKFESKNYQIFKQDQINHVLRIDLDQNYILIKQHKDTFNNQEETKYIENLQQSLRNCSINSQKNQNMVKTLFLPKNYQLLMNENISKSGNCLPTNMNVSNINVNIKKQNEFELKIKYKTEICKFWEINTQCKFKENCAFAHGPHELRVKTNVTNNFKIKKCNNFYELGFCNYGARCQFLHSTGNIKELVYRLKNLYSTQYKQELEEFCENFEKINDNNQYVKSRRLEVLERITKERVDESTDTTIDLDLQSLVL